MPIANSVIEFEAKIKESDVNDLGLSSSTPGPSLSGMRQAAFQPLS